MRSRNPLIELDEGEIDWLQSEAVCRAAGSSGLMGLFSFV
jgi:hypothetical protein